MSSAANPNPWALIIDDSEDMHELISFGLRKAGYKGGIEVAYDFTHAKEVLAKRIESNGLPEILSSDYNTYDESGEVGADFIEWYKETHDPQGDHTVTALYCNQDISIMNAAAAQNRAPEIVRSKLDGSQIDYAADLEAKRIVMVAGRAAGSDH